VPKAGNQPLLDLSPSETLVWERQGGSGSFFTRLDSISAALLASSLAGRRVGTLTIAKPYSAVGLEGLSRDDQDFLRETFLPSQQQRRGAWYLPEAGTIKLGCANLPHHYGHHPRFASGMVADETVKVEFEDQPSGLYFWTVLQPLLSLLYGPIQFRTTDPPNGTRDEQRSAWQDLASTYAAVGLEPDALLKRCRYGAGWSQLNDEERLEAKTQLLNDLREEVTSATASLHRILAIRPLVQRYYARSKRASPTMRQVLKKELQPVLTGYFAGDWLAFLRYIGEQPEADERITTALPEPKLYVQAEDRASAVAATHGVAPAEVRRMLAAFWSQENSSSPVRARVDALREYWLQFDDIHARQASGMQTLWGFVEEDTTARIDNIDGLGNGPAWYAPGSYRQLLPPVLLSKIETLWGGTNLPKWPDRTVSSASPQGLMASALGPAVRFWHGVALTSWFVSEGPYSRTEIADLQTFYAKDLAQLAEIGCPVDVGVFSGLVTAEKKLGKATRFTDPRSKGEKSEGGLEFGSRRAGFEHLRDVITQYRREWTARYIDAYLQSRWNGDLRAAATEYDRLAELKGRAPKAKEFSSVAEEPINQWFGGNACDLYATFGAKSPFKCERIRILPYDVQAFMRLVFRHLGGKNESYSEFAMRGLKEGNNAWRTEWQAQGDRKRLAELAVWYVQLCEAVGRFPEVAEFGGSKFMKFGAAFQGDTDKGWPKYCLAVQRAMREMAAPLELLSL
jgi:hypothetical protein